MFKFRNVKSTCIENLVTFDLLKVTYFDLFPTFSQEQEDQQQEQQQQQSDM